MPLISCNAGIAVVESPTAKRNLKNRPILPHATRQALPVLSSLLSDGCLRRLRHPI